MDKRNNGKTPEPEVPADFAASIDALREGRLADAEDGFLSTLVRMSESKKHHQSRYQCIRRAAEAYRQEVCIEDGRAFLRRALKIVEEEVERDWVWDSFLILADLAHAWQLYADEEQLLRRELEFRERLFPHDFQPVLRQLAEAMTMQGKKAEARDVIRRLRALKFRKAREIWKSVAVILAGLLFLRVIAWRCNNAAALALVVTGGLYLNAMLHFALTAKFGFLIEFNQRLKHIAEVVFYSGVAMMALGLVAWVARGVARDLGWWPIPSSSYPEWFYFTGSAISILALCLLRRSEECHRPYGPTTRPK